MEMSRLTTPSGVNVPVMTNRRAVKQGEQLFLQRAPAEKRKLEGAEVVKSARGKV